MADGGKLSSLGRPGGEERAESLRGGSWPERDTVHRARASEEVPIAEGRFAGSRSDRGDAIGYCARSIPSLRSHPWR